MSYLPKSMVHGADLATVADAISRASPVRGPVYVERIGDRYRWSLTHRGGPYPLLRETAKLLTRSKLHSRLTARSRIPRVTRMVARLGQRGSLERIAVAAATAFALVGCVGVNTPASEVPSAATTASATAAISTPFATLAPTLTPLSTDTLVPATPTPGTTTPAPETATPAPAAGPLMIDWQKIGNPGMGTAAGITASAAAGGRFVVVGDDGDVNAAIWTSGNGRDWAAATVPATDGYLELVDVTASGDGFIAIGTDYVVGSPQGLAFASSDGGHTWQSIGASGEGWSYERVAATGGTIVIAATDENSGQHRFVVSHDGGATWTIIDGGDASTNELFALETTGEGFWAFTGNADSARAEINIWLSADGESWASRGMLPGSGGLSSLAVAHGPLGWVAAADAYRHQKQVPLAWWSADGSSWQSPDTPPFDVSDIFADDAGFIAVGYYFPNGSGCAINEADATGLTWTSTDGLLWRRMSEDGWQGQYIQQLRRYNRTLIGIGVDWNSTDVGAGAVWVADLPHPSADAGPVPSNPPLPHNGCG